MEISTKQIKPQKGRRILVTSDLHGCWRRLERLLREVDFSHRDMLFILGDLIEKGPENLASLRYVMNLAQKDNVTVLMGNVDLSRLEMLENLDKNASGKLYDYLLHMRGWRGTSLFDEMAAELGIVLDSPERILSSKPALLDNFRREFDFIRSLPTIVELVNDTSPSHRLPAPDPLDAAPSPLPAETSDGRHPGGYILVHSGLPTEDLRAVRCQDIRRVLKFDNFPASGLSFHRYVVAGHWPVNICNDHIMQFNPVIDRHHHIISIDGGCGLHKEGQLNMLIIKEAGCGVEDITYTSCDDFPVFQALTPQEPSASPVNIHFLNSRLRMLEQGEEFSKAEHVASGRVLDILNSRIARRDDQWKTDHYTDYLLPVRPGDRLSLVEQTSRGYLVKKDGVCGWYRGRLERADGYPNNSL